MALQVTREKKEVIKFHQPFRIKYRLAILGVVGLADVELFVEDESCYLWL